MTRIILASASPRRSGLLKEWGLKFKVMPSLADESTKIKKPSLVVKELALRKAFSISAKLKSGIVIGADTIVVLNGEIIGKPDGEKDAERILGKLNGTFHRVYSGIAVIDAGTGRRVVDYEVSKVKMRRISVSEVKRLSKKHLDKAGAYAIQEKSDAFVEKIEGDYFNVVGLPYGKLKKALSHFGITI
jgi:septum formation protein